MKKSVLLILLCAILSFSLFAAVIPSGVDNSLENILNLYDVGSETDLYMTAVTSGGVAVLSVNLSEQVQEEYFYNDTIVTADLYIGVEMDNIESDDKMLIVTNIDESRGEYLHFASHYKQLFFS